MIKIINLNKKLWQWAALFFLAVVWGSSFILIKKGLRSFNDFQLAALRIFFAFLFFIPFIYKHIKRIDRQNIKYLIFVGFVGNAIPAFLFARGQQGISSLLAGMLNTITPLFVLIIGFLFFKTKAKYYNVLGVFIGLAGTFGLLYRSDVSIFESFTIYACMIVLAMAMYASSLNVVKHKLAALRGEEITSLAFLAIGPVAGIYLLFSDFSAAYLHATFQTDLFFVLLLGLSSSFIAIMCFYSLVQHTSTLFASSVTYLIPLVAVFWGLFDGETLSILQTVSIIITITGVFLVNKN